jgi:thioredoxin reductase (NADPH)
MTKPILMTIDDDPDVLAAIARDLRREYGQDYRIVRADSGRAALEVVDELKAAGTPVALFLSDQRMPGMGGVEFLEQAATRYPNAKRVLLTAYSDTDAAIAAINQSHVHYYLSKPWDPPEERLFPVISDMLEDWRAEYRPGYGGVRVVCDRWSAQGHAVRDFLARNQVPYEFLDVETSEEGAELGASVEDGDLPLVILPSGERIPGADPAQVAEHVGLTSKAQAEFYDLAIVGGGPGGLAAAVYGGSEGLETVLIEREAPGGQAGTSSRIENYLGFPSGLSGGDLARRAVAQAKRFGVEILTPQEATGLRIDGPYKCLTLSDGSEITCHVLMLAVGVSWKRLPAENADKFIGAGVYYGAAQTEAILAQGKTVYMVGAGNSAGQAAMHFKDFAERVVMLVRGDSLAAKMSSYLVDRIETADNIEVRLQTEVVRCNGSTHLESLDVRNAGSDEIETVPTEYLFVFLGAEPRTDWLNDQVACDPRGFIYTGPDLDPGTHLKEWPLDRDPYMLETNVPGIFACGDARYESVKRVASAVGEGSVSVAFMHQILAAR